MAARFVRLVTLFVALAAFQLTGARVAEAKDRPAHHKLAAPGPALWKVADKDTTIYLFGTVHALPKGTEWYKPHVKAAFESSDELVTEVSKQDLDSVGGLMSDVIYLPEGQNLRDLLPAPDREAFGMALVSLGIPVETFDRYKPWAAAFFLSLLPVQQAGFESDQGVDVKLTQMAGANVKHTALETAAFQIGLFNDMPQDKQIAYLRDVVRSIPEIAPQIEEIAAAWSAGDVDELSKVYLADEALNLKRRRFSVDHPEEIADEDMEEVALDTDEQVDAYLDLIAEAMAQDASKLSDAEWLHMRTMLSTYVNPHGMKYELTQRFRDYLVLLGGDVKLLSRLFGAALDKQVRLPAGKMWDPRIKVTKEDISITFYRKNVPHVAEDGSAIELSISDP